MLITCGVLYVIWPAVYGALVAFGESIISLGSVGAGTYAFFNRLLIANRFTPCIKLAIILF